MKFKLDENFSASSAALFQSEGHEVHTVCDERLGGASDDSVYHACCVEQRCLVTLDMDFSDPLRFDPSRCEGIVVFRLPASYSFPLWMAMIKGMLKYLHTTPIMGALWIIEPGRIRIHRTSEHESAGPA